MLIDAATANTPIAHYDAQLRSADFLDALRHPWIGFRSIAVLPAATFWRMIGNLTVKNTVTSLVLHVEPTGRPRTRSPRPATPVSPRAPTGPLRHRPGLEPGPSR